MSITSYSERKTSLISKNLPENIGPGSYNHKSNIDYRIHAAPFCSSGRRHNMATSIGIPGPGSYNLRNIETNNPKAVSGDVYEKNKVSRIGPITPGSTFYQESSSVKNPGPGSYNLLSTFSSNNRTTLTQIHNLVIIPSEKTAPTIPQRHQSYGYIEKNGKFVQKTAPKKQYSGLKNDTIGPGHYEPSVRYNSFGRAFSKSTEIREVWSKSSAPTMHSNLLGPGEYETRLNKQILQKPKRLINAIVRRKNSNSNVIKEVNNQSLLGIPDSGHYFKKESKKSVKCKQRSKESKHFGTCKRGSILNTSMAETPGPGSYYSSKNLSNNNLNSFKENKIGFTTTAERSCLKSSSKNEYPGPGSYSTNESIEKTSKKRYLRKNSNINKNRNNLSKKEPIFISPGPGTYNYGNEINISKEKKSLSFVFKSTSKRFSDNKLKGCFTKRKLKPKKIVRFQEDNNYKNIKQQNKQKKNSSFGSNSSRIDFRLFASSKTPGPGAYSLQKNLSLNQNLNRENIIRSTIGNSNRFTEEGKSMSHIGPGTYSMNQDRKKSYNVKYNCG